LFIALIPFFGLRNLSLVMGKGRLYAMIFGAPAAQEDHSLSGAPSQPV